MNENDPFALDHDQRTVQIKTLTVTYNPRGGYWDAVRKVPGRAPRRSGRLLTSNVEAMVAEGSFEQEQVRRILEEFSLDLTPKSDD